MQVVCLVRLQCTRDLRSEFEQALQRVNGRERGAMVLDLPCFDQNLSRVSHEVLNIVHDDVCIGDLLDCRRERDQFDHMGLMTL